MRMSIQMRCHIALTSNYQTRALSTELCLIKVQCFLGLDCHAGREKKRRRGEERKRQQTLSRRTCSAWACARGIGNRSDMKSGAQEDAQIYCSHISCVCLCISVTASEILSPNCHYTMHRKLDSHMFLSTDTHSNCSDVEMNFYQCTRLSAVLCVNSSDYVLSQIDQLHMINSALSYIRVLE